MFASLFRIANQEYNFVKRKEFYDERRKKIT